MSFRGLLAHRADILRRPEERFEDRLGEEISVAGPSVFVAQQPNVPCRLTSTNILDRYTDTSAGVINELYKVFMLPSTDIHEGDRLGQVRDRYGNIVAEGLDITGVTRVPGRDGTLHHLEVLAIQYRSDAQVTWGNASAMAVPHG